MHVCNGDPAICSRFALGVLAKAVTSVRYLYEAEYENKDCSFWMWRTDLRRICGSLPDIQTFEGNYETVCVCEWILLVVVRPVYFWNTL